MNIGIFDSGIGGLTIFEKISQKLPKHNIIYYGDSANLPYGNKSYLEIRKLTQNSVQHMFSNLHCQLIVLACNTASAIALRYLQQQWLPYNYPNRRILGVVIPTLEHINQLSNKGDLNIGVIGTTATIKSQIYYTELSALNPNYRIICQNTPELVYIIESGMYKTPKGKLQIKHILNTFIKNPVNILLLGCTHYELIIDVIRQILPNTIILGQANMIAEKTINYLSRHPEIEQIIGKDSKKEIFFSGKNNLE